MTGWVVSKISWTPATVFSPQATDLKNYIGLPKGLAFQHWNPMPYHTLLLNLLNFIGTSLYGAWDGGGCWHTLGILNELAVL